MWMWMWTSLQVLASLSLGVRAATLVQPDWGYYFDQDDQGPGTYTFGYDIEDHDSRNVQFRREKLLPNGTVTGSYGLVEPDGNIRIVHYAADALGYRAFIENSQKANENHPAQPAGEGWGKHEPLWNFLWFPGRSYRQSSALDSALQSLRSLGNPVLEERTPPAYQGLRPLGNQFQVDWSKPSPLPAPPQNRYEDSMESKSMYYGDLRVSHTNPVGHPADHHFGADSSADQSQSYPSFLPPPLGSHFTI